MKIVEVHWSDERDDKWYFAWRVREGQADDAALAVVREEYTRKPNYRLGDIISPTFRIRQVEEGSAAK